MINFFQSGKKWGESDGHALVFFLMQLAFFFSVTCLFFLENLFEKLSIDAPGNKVPVSFRVLSVRKLAFLVLRM